MRIHFLGAAGTVTGSRFLVQAADRQILVDCGMYQGVKVLRQRNWRPFPVDPATIDEVVLTHAHIDHSGYLPRLVRDGFRGPIHASAPTADLVDILLRDAAWLQEEDAAYANRKGYSKHKPAEPLYTMADAEQAIRQLRAAPGPELSLGEVQVRLVPAGHILGATSVRLEAGGHSVLFSGDLGRPHDLLMKPPAANPGAEAIVMESTYGDRRHAECDAIDVIGDVAERTLGRGGVLLIAAFAVGRAQSVLWALHKLAEQGRIPRVPIYLNSPMATRVTHLYDDHLDWHRLSVQDCRDLHAETRFVQSVDESIDLNQKQGPMIVVSASGMLTGGRVVHHLKSWIGDKRNTVLLPGFQAPGTRGAHLVSGTDTIKIHGRYLPVRAEVVQLDVFSAHADADELLEWLRSAATQPRKVWLVHGEPVASDALRLRIADQLHLDVAVAEDGQQVTLG